MTCNQLRPRSIALAALSPSDPERAAALAHARSCPGCAQTLSEGARLLELIDVELRPVPPSKAVVQRVQRAVLAELDRDEGRRAEPGWRAQMAFAGSAALAFALLVLISRHRPRDPGSWVVAIMAASLAAMLAALSQRGASVVLAAGGASLALAVLAGTAQGLAPVIGLECVAIELFAAAVPFAVAALSRGAVPRPSAPGPAAALAAAAALAGQASLHLTCPVPHALPHLLAFHVLGVVLAAVLGARVLLARGT